jgi:p-aminobenzoyl-glutamate transporter AbgT
MNLVLILLLVIIVVVIVIITNIQSLASLHRSPKNSSKIYVDESVGRTRAKKQIHVHNFNNFYSPILVVVVVIVHVKIPDNYGRESGCYCPKVLL